MSWWGWVLVALAAVVVSYLLFVLVVSFLLWRSLPGNSAPPSPTLREIRAEAMTFWDERFYAALESALPPGVCNCGAWRFTNACPIHARSPERTYSLQGIHRHIESNRKREERP